MFTIPLGALIARYGRTYFKWFPAHRTIQLAGVILGTAGFALAYHYHTMYQGFTHFSTQHGKLGLAIFVLSWVQSLLGQVGSLVLYKYQLRYLNFVHILAGIVLFALAVWQVVLGFEEWRWKPPTWIPYLIYGWAGLLFLLYAAGFALLPRERRQAQQADGSQPPRKGSVASTDTEEPLTVEKVESA
ncbi:hypothetical protein V8E36_000926 [Tilletia maclaganii]